MKNLLNWNLLVLVLISACQSTNIEQPIPPSPDSMYFPPLTGNTWETVSPLSLQWNTVNQQDLFNYLEEKGTKGFIVLKNGKIVIEKYFNGHSETAKWNWYSAGKTLTSATVGIADYEGFLNLSDKTSDYLGLNWTSAPLDKENGITIKHQLTMTTGLNDANFTGTNPSDLTYLADAGTRWAYHNGPYTLLQSVVENAINSSFNSYFNTKIKDKIGMNGFWYAIGDNHIFRSTTRDMARFGLLILRNGVWNEETIIPNSYFDEMIATSQNLNPSYGYLWWLNGKSSFILPQSQAVHIGSMIPDGPDDMFMALGANDQRIYVIPSKNLVVVRCGEDAGTPQLTLSGFDNVLWGKINAVIN